MENEWTCGKGLAANAALPGVVGDFVAAMADVLAVHQQALDLDDENARPEHDAYGTLVGELRAVSARLAAIAARMIGYRDLPMGRHDHQKMAGHDAVAVLERMIQAERTLLSRIQAAVREQEAILGQMP
jgi:hypothetical protein